MVSVRTGHLFERSLVEKYIDTEGKCPATGGDLAKEDLVAVQTNKAVLPRPTTATSIPGLLAMFQNEWDAVMLETFTLKQHLHQTRQELSQALYQHDAACRVIARVVKERDEARNALAMGGGGGGGGAAAAAAAAPAESMEVEGGAGGAGAAAADEAALGEALTVMAAAHKVLSKGRKKRPMPDGLVSPDDMSKMAEAKSYTPHQASKPGILCVDVNKFNEDRVASGGADKQVIVFDRSAGKVKARLTGHSKKVTDVAFGLKEDADLIVSASADKVCAYGGRGGGTRQWQGTVGPLILGVDAPSDARPRWPLPPLPASPTTHHPSRGGRGVGAGHGVGAVKQGTTGLTWDFVSAGPFSSFFFLF